MNSITHLSSQLISINSTHHHHHLNRFSSDLDPITLKPHLSLHSDHPSIIFITSIQPIHLNLQLFYSDLNHQPQTNTLIAQSPSPSANLNLNQSSYQILNLETLLDIDQLCLITSDGQIYLTPIPNIPLNPHHSPSQVSLTLNQHNHLTPHIN